jgi:hypothetical protein
MMHKRSIMWTTQGTRKPVDRAAKRGLEALKHARAHVAEHPSEHAPGDYCSYGDLAAVTLLDRLIKEF